MLATVKKWITTNEAYFVYIFLFSIYNIIISSWSISVGSSNYAFESLTSEHAKSFQDTCATLMSHKQMIHKNK